MNNLVSGCMRLLAFTDVKYVITISPIFTAKERITSFLIVDMQSVETTAVKDREAGG